MASQKAGIQRKYLQKIKIYVLQIYIGIQRTLKSQQLEIK